jgi:selenophosphate synthase
MRKMPSILRHRPMALLYWSNFERKCGVGAYYRVVGMLETKKAIKEHKFQIGQTVYFTSRPIGQMVVNDTYQVMKLLPFEGDDYQYRIKSANEAFERVAKESQLDRHR